MAQQPIAHVRPEHGSTHLPGNLEDRFFAVSIDMLCCLDFSGYFRRLAPAWEHTLGFTRDELMSRPFIEFVHPDDRERTLAQNGQVRTGGRALGFENRYLTKDGNYRWLLWNAAPDTDGQVIYSIARDITDLKREEELRQQLLRQLRGTVHSTGELEQVLPVCSYCRKVRDANNQWETMEIVISRLTNTKFSHSICPTCFSSEMEPQLARFESGNSE